MALALVIACQPTTEKDSSSAMEYPETRKDSSVVDTFYGTAVADPYRWLEDDLSAETEAWVKEQNKVTFGYLEDIPYRDSIKSRLTELWNYEKMSAPNRHGAYFYFSKNDGLQNQSVIYRYPLGGEPSEAEVFLDPNTFSEDGTTSLAGMSFSKDGKLLAYQISEGGADWTKAIVIDTESMAQQGDTIKNLKFSGISWREKEGFYYSSYAAPEDGSRLSAMTDQHGLYYHRLGTKQSEDQLIFGGAETPRRYIFGGVSEDGRYLVISAAVSTTGNELYIQDLQNDGPIRPIVTGFDHDHNVVFTKGDQIYIETNLEAPNKRLVRTNLENLGPESWTDIIPHKEQVLNVGSAGEQFFAVYMIDAVHQVFQYDLAGEEVRQIELPGLGSVGGFSGKMEDSTLYYSFTSYVYPSTIFEYDIETGQSTLFRRSPVDFNSEDYQSEQVFYQSEDGTRVPMVITYKKGLERNGQNPTLLYGYGGFNISLTPGFSTSNVLFLEQGGIYAVANLRGGGEYGEAWHQAGTKLNKQNVFDDFIAAAEYLIAENYTSSEKLAIAGGSNGGLLVGATLTQRPDLMQVAFPAVGVLDMLRYHKFTAGAGWHTDYGTADESEEMFRYLLGYSPVHNVQPGMEYPATMVTTGDHDDRVVPAHSFKFAAALQDAQGGKAPVLIRIAVKAGHGSGKSTEQLIQEQTDKWSFLFWNMGYQGLPQ